MLAPQCEPAVLMAASTQPRSLPRWWGGEATNVNGSSQDGACPPAPCCWLRGLPIAWPHNAFFELSTVASSRGGSQVPEWEPWWWSSCSTVGRSLALHFFFFFLQHSSQASGMLALFFWDAGSWTSWSGCHMGWIQHGVGRWVHGPDLTCRAGPVPFIWAMDWSYTTDLVHGAKWFWHPCSITSMLAGLKMLSE